MVFLEQQGIQGEPEELAAQAEGQKDRQEGPETAYHRQPPEAGRGRRQADPGKNPGRVTVADHADGKGHQDGVQAEDRVEDPDLAAGEMETTLQIEGEQEIDAGDDRGIDTDVKGQQNGGPDSQGAAVEPDLHGPGRADRATQFAGAAFAGVKEHGHFRPLDEQRPGGTNRGAGAALVAALFVAPHIPGHPLDLDARLPEVFEAPPEILGVAPEAP